MKTLTFILTLTSILAGICFADLEPAPITHKSHVAEIDRFIAKHSQGKSRLLLDKAITDVPPTAARMPNLVIYPVSAPFDAELKGIGKGEVLGAIVYPPTGDFITEDSLKELYGAYLLFYQPGVDSKTPKVSMVSVSPRDNGKYQFGKVLDAPARKEFPHDYDLRGEGPWLYIVRPPDKPGQPGIVTVYMKWLRSSELVAYNFSLVVRPSQVPIKSQPSK